MRKHCLIVALLVPMWGGCATKRDLQDLQAEISRMQAAQDRLLQDIQQQNDVMMDSLTTQSVRQRGDFATQLGAIEGQLFQIQELTGQGQQRLAELRESMAQREAAQRALVDSVVPDAGDPDELFESAEAALDRGSISTARAGFQEFTEVFPQHPSAPAARLYLAALLHDEGELEAALDEYSSVLELHPDAPEAATALYRAAMVEVDRGNEDRARSMLNQLTAAYPGSAEAEDARDMLRVLR
ncbi:MAG: tetratricopeptide repeat protein [Gemmatimonas sp.]|nr:tetratricopeptide repeat protein [Gemmatimonas sp.]